MKKNFTPLYITNLWGTLNDNYFKTLASFIAIQWVSEQSQALLVSMAAAALVLPYVLCSPLAGRLTQHFRKINIVRVAKIIEIPIMGLAITGFLLQNVAVVITALFLMGLQSSLYSPAKYGLIRDIGGVQKISVGMGGMEAISFTGMLAGTIIASFFVDLVPHVWCYICLILWAILGLFSSYTIRADEESSDNKDSINPIKFLRDSYRQTSQFKGINTIIFVLSTFWWLAASMQIGLLIYAKQELELSAMQTGILLSMAAVGISLGCVLAGKWDKKHFLLGYTPLFSWIVAILLLFLFFVPLSPIPFGIVIFLISALSGFFKVPLDAEIQRAVKGPLLNIILAYFNQVSFIFILIASLTFSILTTFFSSHALFLMTGFVFLLVPIPLFLNCKSLLSFSIRRLLHLFYKIEITGLEHLNNNSTKLILPNHVAVIDPIILFTELHQHNISPLVDENYFKNNILRKILSLYHAIPVPDVRANRAGLEKTKQLNHIVIDSLQKGQNILFYPSGHITKTGEERIGAASLAYNVCLQLPEDVEVYAIKTTGLWGSIWSKKGRKTTPNIGITMIKSLFLVLGGALIWRKKRVVKIEIVSITKEIKAWKLPDKMEFNRALEEVYSVKL